MSANKNFNAKLSVLKKFLDVSVLSNYTYEIVNIGGGEPLLHPKFIEIIRMVSTYNNIEKIYVYTNGILVTEKLLAELSDIKNLSIIVTKDFGDGNFEPLRLLSTKYKIFLIMDRKTHTEIRTEPMMDSLPAVCTCNTFGLYGNKIFFCSSMPRISANTKIPIDDRYYTDIRVNYADNLKMNYDSVFCTYCNSNSKIKNTVSKEVPYRV